MNNQNDHHSDILELHEERAANYEHETQKDRIEAERLARQDTEARRHVCEVVSIGRMFQEKGAEAVRSYLLKVEKARGSAAASRLRQEAWEKIQEAKSSQTVVAEVPVKKST